MAVLGQILSGVGVIISLVCFIIVLVKMFQNGKTGLGILCIVLVCCGVGELVAFIYGWIKAADWNIRNVMIAFTIGWILMIVGGAMNPGQFQYQQFQLQQPAP